MAEVLSIFGKGFLVGFSIVAGFGIFLFIALRKKNGAEKPDKLTNDSEEHKLFLTIHSFIASPRYIRIVWGICFVLIIGMSVTMIGFQTYHGIVVEKNRSSGRRVRSMGRRHTTYTVKIDNDIHKIDSHVYDVIKVDDRIETKALWPWVNVNGIQVVEKDAPWNLGFWISLFSGLALVLHMLRKPVMNIIKDEILNNGG